MLQEKVNIVMEALQHVKDPEIDSISIIDLGMVEKVEVNGDAVSIELLPTFMGCPALDIIRQNVVEAIAELKCFKEIHVQFIYYPPWTSDRVSDEGRLRLKEFGIAPPPKQMTETGEWHVDCPYCGSTYTTIENIFGPTSCRSILYCKSCKNPFEAMKPVSTMM
ncbi:1,2-phenylacetyl-CoA epoxidase subunit PaaD [Cytobacillus solani]|uniref:Phenylacetate-CoA oxygenase n=1 Tax=Cytobacillus solani TaxID=1637975 RepID=A0A0Q3VHM5_9BACI|nr:1,2-phenylacetyl-CoA epoxidase subunit PaaD [Cytobacillus solani]KQL19347.1 phenylacetate-CoA oxygenase [Cytobacillus solani]USK57258.1 phenylacetate-CoA oxygenase subunit PaaJ [Cytobacillus solani]